MSEIERVAKGLTEAQKRAVLWLPANGDWRERRQGDIPQTPLWILQNKVNGNPKKSVCICASITERRESAGRDKGAMWPNTDWRLTPIGRKIRKHLERHP